MPNQSGKIILVLVLILLILGISIYFFLQNNRNKFSSNNLDSQINLPKTSDSMSSINELSQSQEKILSGLGIRVQFPEKSEIQEVQQAIDLGILKNVQPEKAYKFYFNEDPKVLALDKEYSGLTMFFILYPNKGKLSLRAFLPKVEKGEENSVNTLEEVKIGSSNGFKHTQCCRSGGGIGYYFLNDDTSDLILVKAYNRGPNHDLYKKELEEIIKSIKFE